MLKVAAIVLIVLVLAIAVFLIIAMQKPDTFRVERTLLMKAPPERVLAQINDFKAWPAWSPYEKKDPAMQRTLSGAPQGKGAIYEWKGDKNVGHGRMEVLDTTPTKTTIKLDFFTPFEAHNTAEFSTNPQGDATQVTWVMQGPAPLMTKVMSTVFNMDKIVGDDFAAGLASLKAVVEK